MGLLAATALPCRWSRIGDWDDASERDEARQAVSEDISNAPPVPVDGFPDQVRDFVASVRSLSDRRVYGHVTSVNGLIIELGGIERNVAIGSRVNLEVGPDKIVPAEIVSFRENKAVAMPFGVLEGIGLGARAVLAEESALIRPTGKWLGRVINALGEPVDGGGPLEVGTNPYKVRNQGPPAHRRRRVGNKVDLGVRSVNSFATLCHGQRIGIFSGSGVGKSIMLSMFARFTSAEIIVIGMVGERGREVQEFLEDNLGAEGLARSVVVVATSDEPALMRRQAAHMTLAVAEYFRDQGHSVLCLMDSVTRFAMAMREIGLSIGEPPASKGYTPSVFGELPRLLERAGPGEGRGTITGLFTVLVEGDDLNEPISDAVRGILDGHIVLDRSIAERGRYPAVNVLRSVSRTMPDCNTPEENQLVQRAKTLLATYEEMSELIRIGAYRRGADPKVDEAIQYYPKLEEFFSQGINEACDLATGYQMLADILGTVRPKPAAGGQERAAE